jgi:hypothetical protein
VKRALSLCLLISACAHVPRTPEGEKELTRDIIHARHNVCMARGDEYARVHGFDSFRYIQCDRDEQRACLEAGLERLCGEWQWGGT